MFSLRRINHHAFFYTARVSGSNSEDMFDPKVPPEKQKVTYQTKDGRIKTVTKAELQEQMEASEKLMQSLNETWEDKMHRTQEVQKEREKALEELGITVEKNLVGVHTPKKVRLLCFCFAHQLTASVIRCLIWSIWSVSFLSPGSSLM